MKTKHKISPLRASCEVRFVVRFPPDEGEGEINTNTVTITEAVGPEDSNCSEGLIEGQLTLQDYLKALDYKLAQVALR